MPIGLEPTPVADLTDAQINQAANAVVNAYRNNLDTLATALGVSNINRRDAVRILQETIGKVSRNIQMAPF